METPLGAGSAHLGGHSPPERLWKGKLFRRVAPGLRRRWREVGGEKGSLQAYLEIMSFLSGRRCCSGSPGGRQHTEEGVTARLGCQDPTALRLSLSTTGEGTYSLMGYLLHTYYRPGAGDAVNMTDLVLFCSLCGSGQSLYKHICKIMSPTPPGNTVGSYE